MQQSPVSLPLTATLLPPISRRMTSVPSHLDKPPMNQHFPLKYRVHRVSLQAEHKDRSERDRGEERESELLCVCHHRHYDKWASWTLRQ